MQPSTRRDPQLPTFRVPLDRRRFLSQSGRWAAVALLAPSPAFVAAGAESRSMLAPIDKTGGLGDVIHAPADAAQWPAWREQLANWRQTKHRSLRYDDTLYRRNDFAWVPACFSCCFVMVCDETFYDPRRGRYTVNDFLDGGVTQLGGYDALVLWHAYPRIGFDDRNQFDFYRDTPGGMSGLREVARQCHARGVKVFVDYNPWDTGTRREGVADLDALAGLVREIEADGIFLDTMTRGAADFRAKLDAARPGVVLEGEGALPLENIHDHHMSWAQGFQDSAVPGVLRNKWFERRHLQHQIKRWDRDHSGELQMAWMNGSGMMVWENVFGTWVGWNPRDRSTLRLMLPIQRRYAALFSGARWTPLVPTLARGVYASLWEGDGLRLWTLVNRSTQRIEEPLIEVPHVPGARYCDVCAGQELNPAGRAQQVTLSGSLPSRGIGAFLSTVEPALGKDLRHFLNQQRKTWARLDLDAAFPARTAQWVPVASTRSYHPARLPDGMVAIPGATVEQKSEFQVRECGFYEAQSDHFAGPGWHALHQPITFRRRVSLKPFAIDEAPVTNAQFAAFLKASGYRPTHRENLLKHWRAGASPVGESEHPVVYVSLDDARAYARWAGKRLPTEEEWQQAAEGPDQRRYPWGNEFKTGRCNDGKTGGTTPVRAFPLGRSAFGCYDLCGNTWEWTESERTDGRTRFCILKGGSYYKARGSAWYADGGPKPCQFAAKFLLMWPGLDRCATIGFRCAVDLPSEAGP